MRLRAGRLPGTLLLRHVPGPAAQRQIERGRASSLKDVLAKNGRITSQDVNEASNAGDELAAEVWDQAMRYLALACVNITRILDPDEIVLAGGMVNAGDDLMRPLLKHYQAMHWSLTPVQSPVVIATLGSDAGVIGAAGVAWRISEKSNSRVAWRRCLSPCAKSCRFAWQQTTSPCHP